MPAEGDHVWGHGKVNAAQAVIAALTWDSNMGATELAINHVTLFPNPVRNQLWFSELPSGKLAWDIFDLHGQLCQSGQALELSTIDVSGLQPGLYIIQLQSAQTSQGFKFLKHP